MTDVNIRIGVDASGAASGSRVVVKSLGDVEAASRRTVSAAQNIKNTLAGAFAAIGVRSAVSEILRVGDSYAGLNGRLKLVTSSQQELLGVQSKVFEIAQQSGSAYLTLGDLYATTARNAKALGLSQASVLNITEAVSKSIQIAGGDAASSAAGIRQFGQALGSGTLRGDELNSILENTPRLAQAIADGLGVTQGQLRKLGAEGRLTSSAFSNALLSQLPKIESEFSTLPRTFSRARTELQNEFEKIIATADLTPVVSSVDELKKTISDPAIVSGVTSLATGLIGLSSVLITTGAKFADLGKNIGFFFANVSGQIGEAEQLRKKLEELNAARAQGSTGRFLSGFIGQRGSTASNAELDQEIIGTRDRLDQLTGLYTNANATLAAAQVTYSAIIRKIATETNPSELVALQAALLASKSRVDELTTAAAAQNPVLTANADASAAVALGAGKVATAKKSATETILEQIKQTKRETELILQGVSASDAATQAANELKGVKEGVIQQLLAANAAQTVANELVQQSKDDLNEQIDGERRLLDIKLELAKLRGDAASVGSLTRQGLTLDRSKDLAGPNQGPAQQLIDTQSTQASFDTVLRQAQQLQGGLQSQFQSYTQSIEAGILGTAEAQQLFGQSLDASGPKLQGFLDDLRMYAGELGPEAQQQVQGLTQQLVTLSNNIRTPTQRLLAEFSDVSAGIQQVGVDAFNGLADALTTFVTTGKLSFKSLADTIISELIRIQIQKAIAFAAGPAGGGGLLSIGLNALVGYAGAFAGGAGVSDALASAGQAGQAGSVNLGTQSPFGQVIYRAKGGTVPGSGTSDTVPAMLTPGEYVLRTAAVRRIGIATLDRLNQGSMSTRVQRFANGGLARAGESGSQRGQPSEGSAGPVFNMPLSVNAQGAVSPGEVLRLVSGALNQQERRLREQFARKQGVFA